MIGFGKYNLLLKLGQGKIGSVFLARQRDLHRFCAIKIIKPEFSQAKAVSGCFSEDTRLLAALAHPSLVRVFDSGLVGGFHFIAMEYVEGMSVGEILRNQGPIPFSLALYWVSQVSAGLEYAHRKQIAHQNIAPDNIMVDSANNVKLMDFCLAKTFSRINASATGPDTMVGSSHYMSPEQINSPQSVDPLTDLYSLGMTFYHMVLGKVPYPRVTPEAVYTAHLKEPMPSVGFPDVQFTTALDSLIGRMSAKDKAGRFQSTEDLVSTLEAWRSSNQLNETTEKFFAQLGIDYRKTAHLLQEVGIDQTQVDSNVETAATLDSLQRLPSALFSFAGGAVSPTRRSSKSSGKGLALAVTILLLLGILGIAAYQYGPALMKYAQTSSQSEKAAPKLTSKPGVPVKTPRAAPAPILTGTPGTAPVPGATTPVAPRVDQKKPAQISFLSDGLMLRGLIAKPEGNGPFPAVIWNHGTGKKWGWEPSLARFYTSKGYVFFMPFRHGTGSSPGEHPWDVLNQFKAREKNPALIQQKIFELFELYNKDVVAAVEWLKEESYVDRTRIVMSGCADGAVMCFFNSEKDLGLRAFIPFGAGSRWWKENPPLAQRLLQAAKNAKAPIFILQASNDFSLEPTGVLGPVLEQKGKPNGSSVYPPFGKNSDEANWSFACWEKAIPIWGNDVIAFLDEVMK